MPASLRILEVISLTHSLDILFPVHLHQVLGSPRSVHCSALSQLDKRLHEDGVLTHLLGELVLLGLGQRDSLVVHERV